MWIFFNTFEPQLKVRDYCLLHGSRFCLFIAYWVSKISACSVNSPRRYPFFYILSTSWKLLWGELWLTSCRRSFITKSQQKWYVQGNKSERGRDNILSAQLRLFSQFQYSKGVSYQNTNHINRQLYLISTCLLDFTPVRSFGLLQPFS